MLLLNLALSLPYNRGILLLPFVVGDNRVSFATVSSVLILFSDHGLGLNKAEVGSADLDVSGTERCIPMLCNLILVLVSLKSLFMFFILVHFNLGLLLLILKFIVPLVYEGWCVVPIGILHHYLTHLWL